MYTTLLALHSLVRWLVLLTLMIAIVTAYRGWLSGKVFTATDNRIRHITATVAHVQLVIGILLYYISPIIRYFMHNYREAVHDRGTRFFGMEHSAMMFAAVILVTVGSAYAKRRPGDDLKFRTMAIWYSLALLVILVMIPWPFSSLAQRPWFRSPLTGF
jgi:hypothetical protein